MNKFEKDLQQRKRCKMSVDDFGKLMSAKNADIDVNKKVAMSQSRACRDVQGTDRQCREGAGCTEAAIGRSKEIVAAFDTIGKVRQQITP